MSSERIMLRVAKGKLVPADGYSERLLRDRKYSIGDRLLAELRKPRNPGFHRLAHAFGLLCAENIARFDGLDAHGVLKAVQIEGDIACDHMPIRIDGADVAEYRVPQSLSYATMDQAQFETVFRAMCEYVSRIYWPSLTPDQIEQMAQTMVNH